jgi:predicted MFS family arabinose efflux permease
MTASGSPALAEWKVGWLLVLASFVGFLLHSAPISALSAFMAPLADEFGWNRTFLSVGISIGSFSTALLVPFVGALVDRFGSRRLVLPGLVLSGGSIALFAAMDGAPWQWVALWLFHAVFNVAIGAVLWTTAVAGTFRLGQGTAIGITLAGATAAHAIVPPLTVWLITDFGWRLAFVLLGGGIGILAFVLCYFFFFDQRDRARIRSRSTGDPTIASGLELPGLTLAQAARNRALWLIGASIFIIMALTIGFLVHQIEILRGVGISRTNAAWLAGLSGAMGIVGKLVTGVLLDRYRGNLVGGITMAAAALAFVLLLFDSTLMGLVVFAMLVNGYTAGAKLQIASYLTVRYAGMRNFGKIYGMISCLVGLGAAAGPLVAGMIYDTFASYGAFLTAGAVGLGFAAVCLFVLPGYPDWEKERPPSPA